MRLESQQRTGTSRLPASRAWRDTAVRTAFIMGKRTPSLQRCRDLPSGFQHTPFAASPYGEEGTGRPRDNPHGLAYVAPTVAILAGMQIAEAICDLPREADFLSAAAA